MANSTKTRLLLVDDPLPGLFMTSWFLQNKLQSSDTRTVGIYVCLDVDEKFSQDANKKKPIHTEASRKSVEEIIDLWISLPSKRYFTGQINRRSWKAVRAERKIRAEEIQTIRGALLQHGIDPFSVTEIWSRDALVDRHFFYLCPNARAVFVEHGLPDIRNSLMEGNEYVGEKTWIPLKLKRRLHRFKKYLENLFDRTFLYFDARTTPPSIRVSLMTDEILAGNPKNQSSRKLLPEFLTQAAGSIQTSEAALFQEIEGNSALILSMFIYPKPWGPEAKEHQHEMLRSFEDYLLRDFEEIFLKENIKTLIFKSKFFHEEHTEEGIQAFQKLRKKFKVVYLPEFSEKNYPSEFYFPHLSPKVVLCGYSSLVFYGKKLDPQTKFYTYDDWFIEYSASKSHKKHADFSWYRNVFNHEFGHAFEKILPADGINPKHL